MDCNGFSLNVIVVGILVILAAVALIVVFVLWLRDRNKFGDKQQALLEGAKSLEHSALLGS